MYVTSCEVAERFPPDLPTPWVERFLGKSIRSKDNIKIDLMKICLEDERSM